MEEAAEPGCEFYTADEQGDFQMKKCECKKHKKMRTGVKSINFGLAYGMSEYRLSEKLLISVDEARELIKKYFTTFPNIKKTLDRFGNFGKRYGYISTMAPFKRKRYFAEHKYIDADGSLIAGKIERRSKNTPIQGSSADMTKVAMVYIREYIQEKGIPVKMVMTVHDQIDTIVHKDYAETWSKELEELMEKAAMKIITNGLLRAETEISPVWKK